MKLDLNFLRCKLNAIADNTCNLSESIDTLNTTNSQQTTVLTDIEDNTSNLTSTQRTPNILRPTGSSSIAIGSFGVSISNVGVANGTVLGVTLKPGETVNFDPNGINNTLTAIAYNATGTEFLIIYLT